MSFHCIKITCNFISIYLPSLPCYVCLFFFLTKKNNKGPKSNFIFFVCHIIYFYYCYFMQIFLHIVFFFCVCAIVSFTLNLYSLYLYVVRQSKFLILISFLFFYSIFFKRLLDFKGCLMGLLLFLYFT